MSIAELIKKQWPTASAEQVENIVWLTPYPVGTKEQVEASLRQMHAKWGSNIKDAIKGEMDLFDAEIKKHLEKEKREREQST